ncbi:hypothetical protein Goshw_021490 [Gossypium schwendimanii]|uniref:RING-type domain-containing protein n=1 Tax=Gossypium schwendimanii TaxID=34291 RepID=A0A7J9MPH4_GOSSC|nr:hypothetical protein [Gossypium schwendimanii]
MEMLPEVCLPQVPRLSFGNCAVLYDMLLLFRFCVCYKNDVVYVIICVHPISMWSFASNRIARTVGCKNDSLKQTHTTLACSDNESSSVVSRDEGLECPICCESFNIVENVPYVLWCGHTLCKNCVLGLKWAAVKFPTLPVQLPLSISCPWCNLLSFRLVYRGNLMFPRKNYFLLWMVESMNCTRRKSRYPLCEDHQPDWSSNNNLASGNQVTRGNHGRGQSPHHSESSESSRSHARFSNDFDFDRIHSFLWKSLIFFIHLSAKLPFVIIFLLITLYAIPASAAILALYVLITVLFALPSFLILYFTYPCLDWLVNEIIT